MRQVSRVLYIAASLIWLGDILHIVGVLTHHWQDHTHVEAKFRTHRGLFKMCSAVTCYPAEDSRSRRACQAFMIVAAIMGFLSGAVIVVYIVIKMFSSYWQPPKFVSYVSTYACAASFLCSIIGVIIYSAALRFPSQDWGFSFVLVLLGAIMAGLGGVLITVNNYAGRNRDTWSPDDN